jgi:CHAT domain-containing protein
VEKYMIKYVQSASVLAMLRTQYKKEGLSDKFIGFGDPVYDYERFKSGKRERGDTRNEQNSSSVELTRNSYERAGGKLVRLVGTGEEVKYISRILTDQKQVARSLLRLEAKEAYAKSREMEEFGYIHFATHGILEDEFQAIALSQIPGDTDDGFLTLGEIMNSRYNARLVVLSACETGLGKIERGEGVTGLTRAVMYAGSPAAVVSLWSVSDEGTKELMVRLYGGMIKGELTKADALRLAKLDLIRNRNYAHPYFWSAFVMYGE